MSATALQLNWTSVQFASTGLTRVTSVTFSQGGELIEFAGDNNRYPVVIANNMNRPRCSITSGDVATLMGIAPGTSGTITATQNDALGATGGAVNWTMNNAVHQNTDDAAPDLLQVQCLGHRGAPQVGLDHDHPVPGQGQGGGQVQGRGRLAFGW